MLCIYNSHYFFCIILTYICSCLITLALPSEKMVFYKMWKLFMELLHSVLSSLFFFTFIKLVSFWKNSQFLSWLNKKEILRNQKSALLPHYTPPLCHTPPQHTPLHPQEGQPLHRTLRAGVLSFSNFL